MTPPHNETTNSKSYASQHSCDWPFKKGEVFTRLAQQEKDHGALHKWVESIDSKMDDVLRKTGFYAAIGSAIPVVLSIIIAVVVYLVTKK